MSKEFTYWTSVCKRIFLAILAIGITIVSFKIAIFYLPFLIAFIISLIIEPLIKKLMKKFGFTRRLSSIIVFILTFGIIIGLLTWGIATLVSESTNLLSTFNDYYSKTYNLIQNILGGFDFIKLKIPQELLNIIENSSIALLEKGSNYLQSLLTKFVSGITSIPTIGIYFAITILALYFICTDKIYMFCNLLNWIIYTIFCRIKCWIPINYSNRYIICRCTSYTWLRNCNDSMGNFISPKWRHKISNFSNNTLDNNVSC